MIQYPITLNIFTADGSKYNVTNMVKQVTWSGDINTFPRKLEVEIKNSSNIHSGKTLLNYDVGNMVVFYKADKELFRGYIFRKSIDSSANDSFTAYDPLVYLGKSMESIVVKQRHASSIILQLFQKFGVPMGDIEPTGAVINKLVYQNQSLTDIVTGCLEETKKLNGKSFKLYSKQGKAYLTSREAATKLSITVNNVISATSEITIEDTKTQVVVTRGSVDLEVDNPSWTIATEKDADTIKKYGVLQHIEEVDDKTSNEEMRQKAKTLLAELKIPQTTVSIDFIGDSSCITGNIIEPTDSITGILGRYFITADTHTFAGGVHKMTLQLSRNLK